MKKPSKSRAARERYSEFLRADCGESFIEWLKRRAIRLRGAFYKSPEDVSQGWWMMIAVASLTLLQGCSTTLYTDDGKPLARIQSDATRVAYTRSADGAVTFSAEALSNSAPVLAAGKALTPAVMAVGAVGMMNAANETVKAVRAPLLPR